MNIVWTVVVATVVSCTLLASLRLAVKGFGHMPTGRNIRLASHDLWTLSLIVFLPWHLGAFARREISPIPCAAFLDAYARHGLIDGTFSLAIVGIIDMWLLFIPAHSYCINRPDLDRRTVVIARLLSLNLYLSHARRTPTVALTLN